MLTRTPRNDEPLLFRPGKDQVHGCLAHGGFREMKPCKCLAFNEGEKSCGTELTRGVRIELTSKAKGVELGFLNFACK